MPNLTVEQCHFCYQYNTRYHGSGEPCPNCGVFYPHTTPNTDDTTTITCTSCGNSGEHSDHYSHPARCPKCGHNEFEGYKGWFKAAAAAQYATAGSRRSKSNKRK